MKRKHSEARDRAYMLWQESGGTMPLKDIADALHVQPSKVRKWKALDKWSIDELLHEDKEKSPVEIVCRKIGAPIGNKNSVGHKSSTPKRNSNALKTGEYKTICLDALSKAERAMYAAVDTGPFAAIDEAIRLLTLRERRMLEYLNELRDREQEQNALEVGIAIAQRATNRIAVGTSSVLKGCGSLAKPAVFLAMNFFIELINFLRRSERKTTTNNAG